MVLYSSLLEEGPLLPSAFVGLQDSNEADLLEIRRALTFWTSFHQEKLIIEGDSMNAIK